MTKPAAQEPQYNCAHHGIQRGSYCIKCGTICVPATPAPSQPAARERAKELVDAGREFLALNGYHEGSDALWHHETDVVAPAKYLLDCIVTFAFKYAAQQTATLADDIRADGWSVAVHNDYQLNGRQHTFWLFTKGNRCVKGEGETDAEALQLIRAALKAGKDEQQ